MAKEGQLLLERLGIDVPAGLLTEALTHRSYANELGTRAQNERLEFLGDSVLGLVTTEELYTRHPDSPEGELAKMRSAIVNSRALADAARSIDLGEYLLLGKGERVTGGSGKTSILADAMEALFGAVYLSAGMPVAKRLILELLTKQIARAEAMGAGLDWKTSLQELAAKLDLGVPKYVVTGQGPDHDRIFTATVRLNDGEHGTGTGQTKKAAEQLAAESAYKELQSRNAPR